MGKAHVDLRSVTTAGLDLAKHVFQIHAVDADGRIVIATALRRKDVLSFFGALPPCVIGLEACGSAHHWARELVKLGHNAWLMPPNYVKQLTFAGRRTMLLTLRRFAKRSLDKRCGSCRYGRSAIKGF